MEKVKRVAGRQGKPPRARRRYDASRRRAAAQQTRRAIVEAARRLFVERGYAATSMASIAAAAGVSHETVYAAFGPKPALFQHLIELALPGTEEPVPALEREHVRTIRAEPDPRRMIDMFTHVIRLVHERLAPLFDVFSAGARSDPDLKALADKLNERHVRNMRVFAADLAAAGGLREDLSIELAADVIWLMNSSEFYLQCVRGRHWTPDFFEQWLADTWKRVLLPAPGADGLSSTRGPGSRQQR